MRSAIDTWFDRGVFSVTVAFSVLWLSHTAADADLWGHLRFGQDILRDGAIASSDPYSYLTAGRYWINHEWLTEVVFAALYDRFGPAGLIGLKTLISVLVVLVSYTHLARAGVNSIVSAATMVVLIAALRPGLGTIRPQMFTYLCFLFLLLAIHAAENGRQRLLWVLPIVFAVWGNLHGGVLAGVAILGFWSALRLFRLTMANRSTDTNRRRLALLCVLLLSGLGLLLNPYGFHLVTFLIRTATVSRPDIAEWAPIRITSAYGVIYLLLIGIAAWSITFGRDRNPALIAVLTAVAIAPLTAVRHLPLFGLAVVILAGPLLSTAVRRRVSEPSKQQPAAIALVVSPLVVMAGVCLFLAVPNLRCIHLASASFLFPVRAVALLRDSRVEGNLATMFNWGEYAIWHLGPRVKVSIDGRRETVYSEEVRQSARDFEYGRGQWDAVLEGGADLALVQTGSAAANLLALDPRWQVVHEDPIARLFVRRASQLADVIASTPRPALPADGTGLCFPGRPVLSL